MIPRNEHNSQIIHCELLMFLLSGILCTKREYRIILAMHLLLIVDDKN